MEVFDDNPKKDSAESMIEQGEALVKIGKLLKPYDDETRRRIMKAVSALYGIDCK